ncbi:Transcriptional regulator, LysR family (plasmid) [Sinorhizobium alkalisoli]|nr:Transcriptional regulator, LysR family [Sinorhizobium alkalisoli]
MLVSSVLTAAVVIVLHRVATRIADILSLAIVDPPMELKPFEVALIWDERCRRDPEHAWLRREIAAAAGTQHAQEQPRR